MQVLNADYWTNYLQPYIADVGVALVFGVGYYLFKNISKTSDPNSEGDLKENIKQVFSKWSQIKSIQKFNALIVANKDKSTDAFKILKEIEKNGIHPDIITYNCLIDMSLRLDQRDEAQKLFEEMSDFTFPIQPDTITYNILLKGCVSELKETTSSNEKMRILNKVKTYLNDLKSKGLQMNDITYNTAMDAFIEADDVNSAWELSNEMKNSGLRPDLYTYSTLIKGLKASDDEKNFSKVLDIYETVRNADWIKTDEVLFNSVLDTCMKFNHIEKAEEIFHDMKSYGIAPSVITYSILIKGFGTLYRLDKAISVFNEMKRNKIKPNDIIYGCLLNSAVRSSKLELMMEIYENMKQEGIQANTIIYTTLIKGFNKMKKFDKAFEIFDAISEEEKLSANIAIYNAILDCCVESRDYEKLFSIYNYIKKSSDKNDNFPQPNVITYSTVIKGFSKAGKIDEAKSLYEFLLANAFTLDEVLFNTVCDGFARCNLNDLALKVLEDMKAKNVKRSSVIYSILLKMYSNQGNEEKSIQMFEMMIREGIKPSLVTYTTLMQMFIKRKKMDKAISVFLEMRRNNIHIDHVCYNFIINACSFNQKLEKAIEFLIDSFKDGIRLSEETYNNVLEYLLGNKFMKYPERIKHATQILKLLKEKNYSIKSDLYQRVVKLIYNNKDNNKEVEGNLYNNYKNFTNLNENGQANRPRDNLYKKRNHNYK